MRSAVLTILLLAGLGGCATRGTLDSECANFNAVRLPPSKLVQDIQSGAKEVDLLASALPLAMHVEDADPLALSLQQAVEPDASSEFAVTGEQARNVLLLSGGGQWGAFGAGFLSALNEKGNLPHFAIITGVSTGGLQALFIGTLGDPLLTDRSEIFKELMRRYRPAEEKEIVNRDSRRELAVVTGSFAGLQPLRKRIHAALCDRVENPGECMVIRRLARSETKVFIGFVQARDGQFYYSWINELARRAYPDPRPGSAPASAEALAQAQRCIAGAALASAAMPVFFQQVRVGPAGSPKTYFDGGVRQSVFETRVAGLLDAAAARARVRGTKSQAAEPALYVVRNGPTTLSVSEKADDEGNAIDAALRSEAIVVNQLEVQSIADLRLARPTGVIRLVTADRFDKSHKQPGDNAELPDLPHFKGPGDEPFCKKEDENVMFSPAFMACIMRYGRFRASEAWIELSPLPLRDTSRSGVAR